MLKDVGMTLRNKGSIYAATQKMRACNNNSICNPSLHRLVSGYPCYNLCCYISESRLDSLCKGTARIYEYFHIVGHHFLIDYTFVM